MKVGISETSIDLLVIAVGKVVILLLNWDNMYYQINLLLFAISLSYPDSYIALIIAMLPI